LAVILATASISFSSKVCITFLLYSEHSPGTSKQVG
jgi:hypothetical protein